MISVRRTSAYTGAEGQYTGKTQTKRSQRCNRYPDELFELLKECKVWQDEERERQGEKWIDTDRLFTKWDGRPMNPQTPYGWFREFCAKNDFRFCNIHSMRHSHASILIAAGVDVATVSADLGHSNCNTTVNTPKGHTLPTAAIFDIIVKIQQLVKRWVVLQEII